ncbi:MAG: hypothetical protein KGQ41_07160 [Alphaproteobacteria bacterium]|nr:hypothetical protein [Alphaproteobacteria bacterium]
MSVKASASFAVLTLGLSLAATEAQGQSLFSTLFGGSDDTITSITGGDGVNVPETRIIVDGKGRKTHVLTEAEKGRIKAAATAGEQRVKAKLVEKGLNPAEGLYIRTFKDTKKMEIWIKHNGKYELFDTYDMFFSGGLGPKLKQGDKQAVEGGYTINRGMLVRDSLLGRAFNTGYPNTFDKAHHRTGSALMVHAYWASAGCYAIKEKMYELYVLMEMATRGGNEVQMHAFPFKMTQANIDAHAVGDLKKHRDFWMSLKPIYEAFDRTEVPQVAVCHTGIKSRYTLASLGATGQQCRTPHGAPIDGEVAVADAVPAKRNSTIPLAFDPATLKADITYSPGIVFKHHGTPVTVLKVKVDTNRKPDDDGCLAGPNEGSEECLYKPLAEDYMRISADGAQTVISYKDFRDGRYAPLGPNEEIRSVESMYLDMGEQDLKLARPFRISQPKP